MSSPPLLLSSAYFPPVSYFSLISSAEEFLIENRENYIKQTYRNRCSIYSANGRLDLSIPVIEGSFRKIQIKEIRIDYTKRWQQIHLGAIESSYRSAPYFEFYFDAVRDIVSRGFELLTDLNSETIRWSLEITELDPHINYTNAFEKQAEQPYDFRYLLSPKNPGCISLFSFKSYSQTFSERYGFIPGLSILDLIFNMGPDSKKILAGTKLIK